MTYDHNQRLVPDSFQRLFVVRERLAVSREDLETRYELAEDLALHLAERFASIAPDDTGGQRDALRHTLAGLMEAPTAFGAGEAGWVVARLAELCEWRV